MLSCVGDPSSQITSYNAICAVFDYSLSADDNSVIICSFLFLFNCKICSGSSVFITLLPSSINIAEDNTDS